MNLEFLHPERIHWLWAVAGLFGLLAWLEASRRDALGAWMEPPMLARLAGLLSRGRRGARLAAGFLCLALAVLALMRPQSREAGAAETVREASAELMVCLDVSRSMLAEDALPNRLERAKAELRDLARSLAGHRLGLIAFAGRASVLCPLTPDRSFFRLVLDSAGPQSVGRGGTAIGAALRKALDGFGEGPGARLIVLVTDGEDHEGYAREAAKAAAGRGVKLVAIGFGDEAGSPLILTDPRTGERARLRDREGREVSSRLDGALLRDLALATEGAYIPAGVGALDLESILEAHIRPLLDAAGPVAVQQRRPERYQGFVLASLVCLLGSVAAGAGRRR